MGDQTHACEANTLWVSEPYKAHSARSRRDKRLIIELDSTSLNSFK